MKTGIRGKAGARTRTTTVTDMRLKGLVVIFFLCGMAAVQGQDKFFRASLVGYARNMQSVIFEVVEGEWITDNLIHNRLNFRLYAGSGITFALEMRNRFFTGDM
nr:hypothetical protein [Spirochaetales bacterium]